MSGKCYKCEKIATSDEHVPPRCLFPEQKDLPEKDLRVNLIIVGSCDIHNQNKTKDDEFLMIALASSVKANKYGYFHFNTKIKRALKRKNSNFLSEIVSERESVELVKEDGTTVRAIKGKANIDRLYNCFENIAYGLYKHQFGKKFIGKTTIMNDFIEPESENEINLIKLIKTAFRNDEKIDNVQICNPEIFNYQFTELEENGMLGLKISFYEELNVFISFQAKGVPKPFDLGMALLLDGMKVTYKMDDGDITFN